MDSAAKASTAVVESLKRELAEVQSQVGILKSLVASLINVAGEPFVDQRETGFSGGAKSATAFSPEVGTASAEAAGAKRMEVDQAAVAPTLTTEDHTVRTDLAPVPRDARPEKLDPDKKEDLAVNVAREKAQEDTLFKLVVSEQLSRDEIPDLYHFHKACSLEMMWKIRDRFDASQAAKSKQCRSWKGSQKSQASSWSQSQSWSSWQWR